MALVIDLCSGLEGASAAFQDQEVVHVDIERKFKPDIVADVQNLPIKTDLKPDLVLFAPPCNCFSVSSIGWYWEKGKPKNQKCLDAIQLVRNGIFEIGRLKPKYWLMENPMGMLRTVIGKPRWTIRASDYGARTKKMTDLWGNVPFKMLSEMKPWPKTPRGSHHIGIQAMKNAAERAKWPYGLSLAVRDAVLHTSSEGEKP